MPDPAPLVSPAISMRVIAGETFLAIVITLVPEELTGLSSATGRTATFSTTGFSTTSPAKPPEAATNPSDSADPMSPATTAMAHVRLLDESDTGVVACTADDEPSSDGWRHKRSSGGNG